MRCSTLPLSRDEIALGADDRSAAPIGMRRRGEDRLVQHILPIAGEFLARRDMRRDRVVTPASARDHDLLADRRPARLAQRQSRQIEPR